MQLKAPDPPAIEDIDLENLDEGNLYASDEENGPRRQRAQHQRTCKTKTLSQSQVQKKMFGDWLAKRGLTYERFRAMHQAHCLVKSAASCVEGGFVSFKDKLLSKTEIKCTACQTLVDMHVTSVDDFISHTETLSVVAVDKAGQEAQNEPRNHPRQTEEEEIEACMKYLGQFPEIEALTKTMPNVPGIRLFYRCLICKTRRQKDGKLNKLGRPKLKSVQHFLEQHFDSNTHVKNMRAAHQAAADQDGSAETDSQTCKGYCASDPKSTGALKSYLEDFKRWTHFTSLSETASHKYYTDLTSDSWYIKSKNCLGNFSSPSLCCSACNILGDARKGVVRYVSRFSFKYNAATLLSKRMFSLEDEAQKFLTSLAETTFGRVHVKRWKRISDLQTHQLQKCVRQMWQKNQVQTETPAFEVFRSSVVVPCLSVQSKSINERMTTLFAGFANALSSEDMTELQQVNFQIAQAAIGGQLDRNPLIQGILVQCLRKLDKEGRGINTLRGRRGACTDTEVTLIEDAAMTLTMASCNRALAQEMGQNATAPRLKVEELPEAYSLPNPSLAIDFPDQFANNLELVDSQIGKQSSDPRCRLIMAIDHTYLLKCFVQGRIRGEAGMLGGPWHYDDSSAAFMKFNEMPDNALKKEKAGLMLECLVWSPWAPVRQCFSVNSVPMTLARRKKDSADTLTKQGNLEMLHIVSRLLGSGAHLVKGITFDAHMSHAYFKEALFGYFETAKKEELPLSELPFFCEVEYIPLPSHALPRLPMNLCRYKGEFIWPLPGSCHAAKCAAGQLNSPLRCLMFGRFVADSSHARSYGLPPAAYARSEPMSDWLHAMLYNPYYTVRSPDILTGEADVPWQLRGFLVFNLTVALCTAVTMHRTMAVVERCQNAMCGFLLIDLFGMLANLECSKRSLPRGSLSMAPQTARNLQSVALSVIGVCATLGSQRSPWQLGHNRMTELPIEEWFGRLRTQMASAQFSVRAFWQAAARQMIKQQRCKPEKEKKVGSIPPPSPELSPSDFFEASEKALSSAYRFVAFCAGITPASLEEVYKQHCKDNVQSPDDLADHEWEDDFLDEENVDEVEAQQVVQHLQEEAQLTMACASDDFELEADLQAADLGKNMPDMADLRNVIDAPQDAADCAAPFGHRNEGPKSEQPRTLHHAVCFMTGPLTASAMFNRIWRLVMYLRYWQDGGDRHWIPNPRNSRRTSSKLNWYQWNEKKIKELSMEEDDVKYRKRAGRLDKWKQLAREAADQRAQSTGQNITLPESIESGNIVLAVVSRKWRGVNVRSGIIGMVLTIWVGAKKPRPATRQISIKQAVAIRVVEMQPASPDFHDKYTASDKSMVFMLQPHCIVSVLDIVEHENTSELTTVTLSPESILLAGQMDSISEWWPPLDPADPKNAAQGDLYPARKRGRKKRRANEKEKKTAPKPKPKKKGLKKAKQDKRKGALALDSSSELPASAFKKSLSGKACVVAMMEKILVADRQKFEQRPLFTVDGLCRMKVGKCKNVEWSKIRDEAYHFFLALYSTKAGIRWSEAVHGRLQQTLRSLEKEVPNRKPWLRLIKEICDKFC
ncbi:unnamed protein product [Durusdinium trenchii]|uniref:Uncharacterized protein n=1 Tax=Durusdinium trenchii TaxID=1381693 RepID=A0ABP0JGU2_9DINO